MLSWFRCKKNLLCFAVGIICLFAFVRVYYRVTDDFRIGNFTYDLPFHPEWEIAPLSYENQKELDRILSQQFSYIGKGAQSYAFESDDGRYVLKFFKFKHLKPSLLAGILPKLPLIGDYQEKEIARKERKLNGVFKGYKLAYDVNRSEAGLLFIQLNPNHHFKPVVVRDKLGLAREIDLGSVVYIVQEKGQTLRNVLKHLLSQGDLSTAKQRIGQIFNLYLQEYQKGIYDHDHGVMQNIGFVGERPIHLDVGKLTADDQMRRPEIYRDDLFKVMEKIESWVKQYYPNHYFELKQDMDLKLAQILN
jgi:hypothetical protein